MAPLVFECKAFGAVEAAQLGALHARLKALSEQAAARVDAVEVCLRGPPSAGQGAPQDLRCRFDRTAPEARPDRHRWHVRTEGAVLRGKAVQDLPATLRSLVEVEFEGDAPAFWGRLGYREAFRFFREGAAYLLSQAGHTIQVALVSVRKGVGEEGGGVGEEVAPGLTLVEASALAPEGHHLPAAKALGSLAALLRPLVDLQKQ